MNAFLDSIKTDLLDRRLLPLVGLVLVALVAAIGYLVLGGSSAKPVTSANVPAAVAPQSSGVAVTAANTNTEKAIAETTDGIHVQRKGSSRDPFTPLAGTATTTAVTSAPVSTTPSTGSSSSSTESSGGSSTGSSGGSSTEETKTEAEPKTKTKKTVYHVTVLFGSLTPDPETNEVKLTRYTNLKLFAKLPDGKSPLIVFRGVTKGGKSATFTIVGEAIIHGSGACLPSATQCEAIDLKVGQHEIFEYLPEGALAPTSYELNVVSIKPAKSSAKTAKTAKTAKAGVADASWAQSKAGWEFLREADLLKIPDLVQSSQPGVLVFVTPRAHKASAHVAVHGPRISG
jgi:hypothetical protein